MTTCHHTETENGRCNACGEPVDVIEPCIHDVVLNGACFYCGETNLDPAQMSPKKLDEKLIPAARLKR
jgi:hypothetical protein